MIPRLREPITWTGTHASAAWVVDRVNSTDGGRYAEGEIISQGYDGFSLTIDTLDGVYTLYRGDTLVKEDTGWRVNKAG